MQTKRQPALWAAGCFRKDRCCQSEGSTSRVVRGNHRAEVPFALDLGK